MIGIRQSHFTAQPLCELFQEISLGLEATLKLTSGTRPKLHAVSPAMWIAASARIMAALYDSDDLGHGAAKDYMAYTVKIGELASRSTWAARFWRMTRTDRHRQTAETDRQTGRQTEIETVR